MGGKELMPRQHGNTPLSPIDIDERDGDTSGDSETSKCRSSHTEPPKEHKKSQKERGRIVSRGVFPYTVGWLVSGFVINMGERVITPPEVRQWMVPFEYKNSRPRGGQYLAVWLNQMSLRMNIPPKFTNLHMVARYLLLIIANLPPHS